MITIKTLHLATAQEVFDQVKSHLFSQGKRSLSHDGKCRYRGRDTTSCAAGCLISDEEYSEGMEGYTWYSLVEVKKGPYNHIHLIMDLQRVHDLYPVDLWPSELATVAYRYGLKY